MWVHIVLGWICLLLYHHVEASLAPVLGIDPGNAFLKTAVIAPGHNLEIVLNTQSQRKTRNVFALDKNGVRLFGEGAYAQQTMSPNTTLHFTSSLLMDPTQSITGGDFYPVEKTEVEKRKTVGYKMSPSVNMTGEEIFGHMMTHVVDLARTQLDDLHAWDKAHDVEAVVAVPAGLSYRGRQLLEETVRLGGVHLLGLVTEPLGAAVSHSVDLLQDDVKDVHKIFLNVGHVNVQGCLVHFYLSPTDNATPTIEMLECAAIPHGAQDVDAAIANIALKHIQKKLKINRSDLTSRALRRVMKESNRAKHVLSTNQEVTLFFDSLHKGNDVSVQVSRADLETQLLQSEHMKSIAEIKNKLTAALPPSVTISAVELLGGGWRVPVVQAAIETMFAPVPCSTKCNADEAMALGSAMIAANRSATYKFRPLTFIEKTPYDLKVEVKIDGDVRQTYEFPRHTPFDTHRTFQVTNANSPVRILVKDSQDKLLDVQVINGFDMIQKLREKAMERRDSLKKTFDEEEGHEWETVPKRATEGDNKGEGDNKAPTLAVDNDVRTNITIAISPHGLVKVTKARATWEEVYVKEDVKIPPLAKETETGGKETETGGKETAGGNSTETEKAGPNKNATESTQGTEKEDNKHTETETETKKEEEKKTEEPIVLKRHWKESMERRSRALTVTSIEISEMSDEERSLWVAPYPLTSKDMREYKKGIRNLIRSDEDAQKLDQLRNKLEEVIYAWRGSLNDDEIVKSVTKPKERKLLVQKFNDDETWLYEHGFDANITGVTEKLKEIEERMAEVKDKVDGINAKDALMTHANNLIDSVQKKLINLQVVRTWMKEEETKPLKDELAAFQTWLQKSAKEQSASSVILTQKTIDAKWKSVQSALTDLSKKRRPRTKKENATNDTKTSNKDTAKVTGKEAFKEAIKETRKEPIKETGKETGKETEKETANNKTTDKKLGTPNPEL